MTAGTPSRLERLRAVRLYLIATVPGPPDLLARVAAAAQAGVGAVQLRLKGTAADALPPAATRDALLDARRDWLVRLRAQLPGGVLLLVNDDLDAVHGEDGALLADGVHLGREDAAALPGGLREARARLGADLLLGTSTRTLAEVLAAREQGADHAGFGAMAPTATKAGTVRADPAELARCTAALAGFPLFPIGGLGPHNLHLLRAAGCRRAAVGSAILEAPDPAAATRALLRALE